MTADDDGAALLALVRELEAEEARLVFPGFDNDDAFALGSMLVDRARERALPVTVDVRRHGQVLFHVALPGTSADNDAWIERKSRVVDRYDASSYLVGRRLAHAGETLDASRGVDPASFAAHGGAFPVRVRGVGLVGSVAVSGLAQAADHSLVVEVVKEYLSRRS